VLKAGQLGTFGVLELVGVATQDSVELVESVAVGRKFAVERLWSQEGEIRVLRATMDKN